ncbi:hypothetical protein SEA_ALTADENA_10 [Arthrobacter phage Altadena]|uniref:Uncharacterized protein n=1 Tax=Arthrobacter phage Altadena TaxID=3059064 RepID=A0AA96KIE2_9CAUD|nr:hypothetical protein SEA_ALTADENA_10 [Arthrobacter phage Altadena]
MAYTPEWGVNVEAVSALAPHVTIASGTAPSVPADPLYSDRGVHKITAQQVEGWIASVSSRVAGRLWRLSEIPETHPAREGLVVAAADLVANGAAAYLVDAAFPAKASPNDQTSYGAVLWNRYEGGLAELEARVVTIIDGLAPGGASAGPATISAEFPPALFPDTVRW